MSRIDLIDDQNDYKAHIHNMALWPKQWEAFDDSREFIWIQNPLQLEQRDNIPEGPGIYSLIIQPSIARHPSCSYLMYIGKAKSLRNRFTNYLSSERKPTGRPMIYRLLNMYSTYLYFCYIQADLELISSFEEEFLDAYIPPANKQFSAKINKIVGAF